ncbi:MAG: glycosyltransferase [Edaphobacter sp.]|uniref:glycosyltransferase family 2 protein n=1 Tax=Edaphobacter sp. TaxID=1934404 RepID=UPI00239B79F5|nr:glycosyltransferase [Edaphobacter sp.]MDE1178847.1 glycosyltransferase [Edaphobacter sp.]
MRLSVLIPTYQRPEDLTRCLEALSRQQRLADEITITVRDEDTLTRPALEPWLHRLPLQVVTVSLPGVVHALNQGLERCTGDIVTITDDDSAPHPDWLLRIEQHFAGDPQLGGLGGRDAILDNGQFLQPTTTEVGRLYPYGRMIGNHHLGMGPARVVEHLKGVNMSWRRKAIGDLRFDEGLRGKGAQVYFELAFSLAIATSGWRLKYDPAVLVDHFPAKRYGNDQRGKVHLEAVENTSYNYYWAILRYLPAGPRQWAALTWEKMLGTANRPGWLRMILSRARGNSLGIDLYRAAQSGRIAAKTAASHGRS